uniref:WPP domain-interacting protein 2 n=1 Tax=Erigeron canadensis TaxID=72917 RepID=UPI001CB98842|nr:WPP domain-interacting protein 2 [Erigeron canadensis]
MELGNECLDDIEKSGESVSDVKNNGNHEVENIDRKVLDGDEESVKKAVKTKGRGLKKWRRIRRAEPGKETSNSVDDSNRKRGMSVFPTGMKQRSDGGGSSSSTNAVSNVVVNGLDRVGLGQGFDIASRADSENSRSSTGASAPPRMNHELPMLGQGIDRNVRNVGGMGYGISVKGDGREKGLKKAKGVRIKKENSISSMESDSRSNNFVFMQGASSMTSNGRRNGRSGNYEEDDSDDGRNGDGCLNEGGGITFSKNEGDFEDVFQNLAGQISWGVNGDKADGHVGSEIRNTLLESIMPLQLAQEALEREVQKLRDVGQESTLSSDNSVQPSGSTFVDEEWQFSNSNQVALQSKLEEALAMLKLKDTKISKLESALNAEDIKSKHEELLTQRISAELEYLVIVNTIQNIKAEDSINLVKCTIQQTNVPAVEPVQLDDACIQEDAKNLENRVSDYAYYFTLQLVLLLVVLYLFVLKFSNQTVEIIPT